MQLAGLLKKLRYWKNGRIGSQILYVVCNRCPRSRISILSLLAEIEFRREEGVNFIKTSPGRDVFSILTSGLVPYQFACHDHVK